MALELSKTITVKVDELELSRLISNALFDRVGLDYLAQEKANGTRDDLLADTDGNLWVINYPDDKDKPTVEMYKPVISGGQDADTIIKNLVVLLDAADILNPWRRCAFRATPEHINKYYRVIEPRKGKGE